MSETPKKCECGRAIKPGDSHMIMGKRYYCADCMQDAWRAKQISEITDRKYWKCPVEKCGFFWSTDKNAEYCTCPADDTRMVEITREEYLSMLESRK